MPGQFRGSVAVAAIAFIVILAIAAAALFLFILPHAPAQPQSTAPQNLTISRNVSMELPNGSSVGTQRVLSLVSNALASSNALGVSYNGSATVSGFGVPFGVSVPIRMEFLKYLNSSRLDFSANFSLGSVGAEVIRENGTASYTCTEATGVLSGLGSSSNYSCTRGNASITSSISNSSTLSGVVGGSAIAGNAITLTVAGPRSYNGLGCLLVEGSGRTAINQSAVFPGRTNMSYTVSSCLSGSRYIPLNISSTIIATNATSGKQSAKIVLVMYETSIGSNVTQAEVTALPGPVK